MDSLELVKIENPKSKFSSSHFMDICAKNGTTIYSLNVLRNEILIYEKGYDRALTVYYIKNPDIDIDIEGNSVVFRYIKEMTGKYKLLKK